MKLRLGKLPSNSTVRLTVVIPELLKQQLDRYANLHSQTWNQSTNADQIIPFILAQFLANDRAFQRAERSPSGPDKITATDTTS